MRPAVTIIACLTLAACGGNHDEATANAMAAADFVPPAIRQPTPMPGQAHTTPLAGYVGHYPDEPVDGVSFYDRTEVATALDQAVTDAGLRHAVVESGGPRTPVFRAGKRIAAWGCEAHNCGDHNWTLLVDPADGHGELCVHEGGRTLWRSGGPPQTRPGDCPSASGETG